MTTFLTPESPLGLAVQQLLLEERRGLTVPEIRRRLRQRGTVAEERSLRELLAHPRIFTGLSGDRFSLVDGQGDGVASAGDEHRGPIAGNWAGRGADASNHPYLVNLPRTTSDYVVLDLETTGLEAGHDRIVQLVAIRYRDGRPTLAINYYFNPAPVTIPYTVQVKIGLTRHPECARPCRTTDSTQSPVHSVSRSRRRQRSGLRPLTSRRTSRSTRSRCTTP